jgi:hypothetical protein
MIFNFRFNQKLYFHLCAFFQQFHFLLLTICICVLKWDSDIHIRHYCVKKINKNALFAPYFNEFIKIERFLIKLKETIN